MRMLESENISQYCTRVKDVVNAIRDAARIIDDETVVRKVLITLLPKYAIRVSTIQELRCIPRNFITLEGLVRRLTDNFDNVSTKNVKTYFKSKLTIANSKDRKKKMKRYADSNSETNDEDIDEILSSSCKKIPQRKRKI